jgi:hypothetical protein
MSWLSSLLGLDAQHNAGVAQKQATSQQDLQNKYGQQAQGVYGGLEGQGQFQTGVYNQNYLNLLSHFGHVSGVGGLNGQPNSTAASLGGSGGGWNMAQPTNAAAIATNPGLARQAPGQSQEGGILPDDHANNPYSLDQNQTAQLNQINGNIAKQAQSAIASFQQQMVSRGITDPRAMELGQEQIQEHFAGLQSEAQTSFYETVKQDKEKALQYLIAEMSNYGAQGISEQEAAGSGFLGLASGSQAAANAQQGFSLEQQQLANNQQGGLLNLLGFGLGGGFNSQRTPGTAASTGLDALASAGGAVG